MLPALFALALGANLLVNPSFEGGYYHQSMSNFIPAGWHEWFQGREPGETRLYWMPEPEFGIIYDRPGQSVSGRAAARWFNIWAIHNAGLYQQVKVPANAWLRFSAWMLSWSSQHDRWRVSESWQHRWVGIDPTGGTDPFAPTVVWGKDDATMDEWTQLSVVAQARGDTVTVFTREQPDWPVKHNDCLVDDAELVVVEPPAQPAAASAPITLGTDAASGTVTDFAYHQLEYPGHGRVVTIAVDAARLGGVGFRVYAPNGKLVARSGDQPGLSPNLAGDLIADDPGTYTVQVYGLGSAVDYRIWIVPR